MKSDNLSPAGTVPEWVFRLDAPPPDPLHVPEDAVATRCPQPGCNVSLRGLGTITHLGDGWHGWEAAPTRGGLRWVLLAALACWAAIGIVVWAVTR